MITRAIIPRIKQLAETFPALAIVGARQSGKTTLAKMCFPNHKYVSLEDPDLRAFAADDPRAFLAHYSGGAILDEMQRAPELFSYLQGVIDADRTPGSWVLTGSHHFLLLGSVSQSLAGRIAIVPLAPFAYDELGGVINQNERWQDAIFRGFYPEVVTSGVSPSDWYASYVVTFVERDVRSVLNVGNLQAFERFIRMTAARSSQLLNLSSLAVDCGITQPTVKSWLSILQTSGLVHLLKPHHANYGKRLIKAPKLYWNDTGLLCYLLRIAEPEALTTHPFKGAITETYVVGECLKAIQNCGSLAEPFFWRDSNGREVDLLIDQGTLVDAMEVKSSETLQSTYFSGLRAYRKLAKEHCASTSLVYLGSATQQRSGHNVIPWREVGQQITKRIQR
ncbi:MAG: ATP-binding protein [SAR324 cluster bacterium]|nr:ATP-binding protein [SAR324 cluster bacterium]